MPHDGQVVRDEQVREAELLLQLLQQVDDLRLNRNVQCRHRLVRNDEIRLGGDRSGDSYPLPLAPGELVRGSGRPCTD